MRRAACLPADIEESLRTLGSRLLGHPEIIFAYLFGGAVRDRLTPLSDVDVAVYLDESVDPIQGRLEVVRLVTTHLGTDAVDVVVLNTAPTALVGRILQSRRVVCDRYPFRRHRFESVALRKYLDFRLLEHRLLAMRYPGG